MGIMRTGGWEDHSSDRGVNGPIGDLLFPITHGVLYYPGYDVLPPFVVYRVDRFSEADFEPAAERLRERMRTIEITAPIASRQQNGGGYFIPSIQLKPGLGDAGGPGVGVPVGAAAPQEPASSAAGGS